MQIIGKNLKGKELGRGLSQRPDGRYMARAQVEGYPIVLYGWKLKELKKELALAVDEAKRNNLLPGMDGRSITLNSTKLSNLYRENTLSLDNEDAGKAVFLGNRQIGISGRNTNFAKQMYCENPPKREAEWIKEYHLKKETFNIADVD